MTSSEEEYPRRKPPRPHVDGNVPPSLFTHNAGDSPSIPPGLSSLETSSTDSTMSASKESKSKSPNSSLESSMASGGSEQSAAAGTSAQPGQLESSVAESDKSSNSSSRTSSKSYTFYPKEGKTKVPDEVRRTNYVVHGDSIDNSEESLGPTPVNELFNDVTTSATTVINVSTNDAAARKDHNQTPVADSEAAITAPVPAGTMPDAHREANQSMKEAVQKHADWKYTIKIHTWDLTRKELYDGTYKQGEPLASRKSVKFTIPITCMRRIYPEVILHVIPCENEESRYLSIEGELVIRRGCSRYRWLVDYCRCSILLSVKVINPLNSEELSSSEEEFEIQRSNLNRDHHTRLKLSQVLDHKYIFYNQSIKTFNFQATVKLFEHGVRRTHGAQSYECKEVEDECEEGEDELFIEIVPTSESL